MPEWANRQCTDFQHSTLNFQHSAFNFGFSTFDSRETQPHIYLMIMIMIVNSAVTPFLTHISVTVLLSTTSIHILYQIQTLQCTYLSIISLYAQYLSFLGTTVGYRDTCTKTVFSNFSSFQLRPSIPTSYGYNFRLMRITLSRFVIPSVS